MGWDQRWRGKVNLEKRRDTFKKKVSNTKQRLRNNKVEGRMLRSFNSGEDFFRPELRCWWPTERKAQPRDGKSKPTSCEHPWKHARRRHYLCSGKSWPRYISFLGELYVICDSENANNCSYRKQDVNPSLIRTKNYFFPYFYCLRCSKGVFDEKRDANFILLTGYRQKP